MSKTERMGRRRVAVTGLGLVSPYGGDLSDFFVRLLEGESAIRFLRTDDVPVPLAIPFVKCPNFDADALLGRVLAGMMDRFAQLVTSAAFDAWQDAGFPRVSSDESREDWGGSWGSAMGVPWLLRRLTEICGREDASEFRRCPSSLQ